ncbi:hypothetical protein [Streptomyces iconiensis]|uniref:Transcriptional regulator n=1 Tax=Streptomyces iconiensis TaxID=1384038 RepID=A0ABT7A4J5_9ACTN|nr:hypothetical protein [Streptomyces iconiensis]MDJ1136268.1 hypothetical protein [Streptomyces iconiensis]
MPDHTSGSTAVAVTTENTQVHAGDRQQRLAELLADMVPGARTIRVSQLGPDRSWPSPHARAFDERGRPLGLNRAQRLTVARWVMRASPELDWAEPHDFDLVSGALLPAAEGHAVANGGC